MRPLSSTRATTRKLPPRTAGPTSLLLARSAGDASRLTLLVAHHLPHDGVLLQKVEAYLSQQFSALDLLAWDGFEYEGPFGWLERDWTVADVRCRALSVLTPAHVLYLCAAAWPDRWKCSPKAHFRAERSLVRRPGLGDLQQELL